jgi:hypothetical protein
MTDFFKDQREKRDFNRRVDRAALKKQANDSGYPGSTDEEYPMRFDPRGALRDKISDHMEATGNKATYDIPSAQNEVLKETNRKNMLAARDKDALNAMNKRQGEKDAMFKDLSGIASGIEKYKKGGSVKSSASKRADGIATKGKTKGRMI